MELKDSPAEADSAPRRAHGCRTRCRGSADPNPHASRTSSTTGAPGSGCSTTPGMPGCPGRSSTAGAVWTPSCVRYSTRNSTGRVPPNGSTSSARTWPAPRSSSSAPPSSSSATCGRSLPARRSGASCSPSRRRARTWPRCVPPRPRWTAGGTSRARRSGPAAPSWQRTRSCSPAPAVDHDIVGSRISSSRWTAPALRSVRWHTCSASPNSMRCSSMTFSSPMTASSARSTAAGRSRWAPWRSSALPSPPAG